VRVLLTRDQLSDLHDVLKQVLGRAEEGLLSPQNFLNELKSLAATLSRTPEQLGATTATTAGEGQSLADLGFMREYIEGLPYTGEVMGLSLEDWQSWPTQQQVAFLNRLEEKVNYYRALHDHTDLWVSLDGGSVGGDSVFPVPLEMLPTDVAPRTTAPNAAALSITCAMCQGPWPRCGFRCGFQPDRRG
jgi:hypothetical protein